jgi:D-alanyl-D-alanine carboxypeptidase
LLSVTPKEEEVLSGLTFSKYGTLLSENLCLPSTQEDIESEIVDGLYAGFLADLSEKKVLVAKNVYQKINPASVTILATTLTVLENMELSEIITVPKEAVSNLSSTSTVGLEVGDKITVEQLIYGMLLCSGIDAANTLAIACSGSIKKFANLMNETVRKIGCTDTNFTNPGGITDANHYTTVFDIYLVMSHLMENSDFMNIIENGSYEVTYQQAKGPVKKTVYTSTISYMNGERTVPSGIQVLGGKTGTTPSAGCCLALFLKKDEGTNYIAIGMKAPDKETLYLQIEKLIAKIFN